MTDQPADKPTESKQMSSLTGEDLFVLVEVEAMGYVNGAAFQRASGRWVIAALSPTHVRVIGEGATRSKAIWALRDAVFQTELPDAR